MAAPPTPSGRGDPTRANVGESNTQGVRPLRVLILEDQPTDAELMIAELRRHGLDFDWQIVDTEAAYVAALDSDPDVILSDYSMPGFKAPRALEILQARRADIPFIVATGSISEEVAVDCMKRGAADYLLKDRLVRLGPAVAQAIAQARLRRERSQALQTLQESEDRFRRLVENAVDIIYRFEFEPSPHFSFVSPAVQTMIGYSPEEFYADPDLVVAIVHPDDRAALEGMRASDAASSEAVTTRWTARDGSVRWGEHRRALIRDQAGRVIAAEGIIRDITLRKRAEEELRKSKQVIEGILDAMPVRVFWKDKNLVYLGCNAIFARDAGFADPKDLIGKDDHQMGWRDQAEAYRADDREVIETGRSKLLKEEPQTTPEGNTITLLTSKLPLRDSNGEISGLLGTYMDITKRKQAEAALIQSENQFRAIFELASIGIAQADSSTGQFVRVNQKMCEITGYAAEELLGLRVRDITHPDDRHDDVDLFQRVVRGEDTDYRLEKRYVRKDGSVVWVNVNMTVIRDDRGRPIRTVATIEDITERRRADEALRQSEALFRSYFELPLIGIAMSSTEKRWIQVNDRLCSILGYSRDELLKMTWTEVTQDEDLEADVRSFDRLLSGEIDNYELEKRFIRKDGEVIWTRLSVGCVRKTDGGVDYLVVLVEDISERRAAEDALRASEDRYRLIAENTADVIWTLDLATRRLTYVSPSVKRLRGFRPEEVLAQPFEASLTAESLQRVEAYLGAALAKIAAGDKSAITGTIEADMPTKDGGTVRTEVVASALTDASGRVTGVLGVTRDITERKQAEDELRSSERRYRQLFTSAMDGIAVADAGTGILTDCNDALQAMVGRSREELIGQPQAILHPPQPLVEGVTRDFIRSSEHLGDVVESKMITQDGVERDVEVKANVIGLGERPQLIGIFRDITEHKRAENALRKSEAQYRHLFESANDAIVVFEPDTEEILDVNAKACELYGFSREDLVGTSLKRLTVDVARGEQQIAELMQHGLYPEFETIHLKSDGTPIHIQVTASVVDFGGIRAVLSTNRDVTQRKRSEEERRRLAAAIGQATDAVVVTDTEAHIVYVNPAFCATTGFSREEVLGQNPRILKSGRHEVAFYQAMWRTLLEGRTWRGHIFNRRKDGSVFEEEATISPVRGEAGTVTNYVAVKRDVTHEVALQAQLNQAQKMEAVGRLAGGIAHDFNNLLQAILSQIAVLQLRLRGSAGAPKPLEEVDQLVRRGSALTRQLLLFARPEPTTREPLDLNEVVRGAVTLLRRVVRENVAITTDLSGSTLPILGDRGQLGQVLMNLAVNASDAMPEGGRLTLRTGGDASFVWLAAADTGHGIPEAVLDNVFEPFFTTKAVGKGTGLGLSVVHGIVSGHGGTVEVASAPSEGATFTVTLPRAMVEVPVPGETRPGADEPPAGRGERVLLVEDEDGARQGLTEILGALGYAVTAAASGEEAGALPAQPAFDLVLTDLLLPGVSGPDLALGLRERWPGLKVVVMSGYSVDEIARGTSSSLGATFLQKPFDVSTLATAVRAALDKNDECV